MPEKELFKGCKYFAEFLLKYNKQPNPQELAVFYYNRYVEAGKKTTLPYLTEQWIADFVAAYQPIFAEKSVGEAVSALKAGLKGEKVQ